MLEATWLVCQALYTCRILMLVISYITVKILFFGGFFWLILVIFNLIFKNNHLTYLSGTFTISKKEKNLSNMKDFCWFSGFALHYESVESVEIWQGFALILGNKLHYFLSALLSKPQIYKISRKLNHGSFWTER